MYNNEVINELKRLRFEDFLWITYAILCFLNVLGDQYDKEYLETNNINFQTRYNYIFEFTLVITFFIYIYFFSRNYNSYKKAPDNEKELYKIRIFGSIFLICGVICLIYFQTKIFKSK